MADEADIGSDLSENERAYRESEIRRKASKLEAESTGYCLSCEEELPELGRRWCDAECRDMWERLRNG